MLSQLSTAMQTRTEASSLLFTPWDATYTRASKAWKITEEWRKQAGYVGQLSCRVTQIAIAVLTSLGFLVSLLPAALGTGLNLFAKEDPLFEAMKKALSEESKANPNPLKKANPKMLKLELGHYFCIEAACTSTGKDRKYEIQNVRGIVARIIGDFIAHRDHSSYRNNDFEKWQVHSLSENKIQICFSLSDPKKYYEISNSSMPNSMKCFFHEQTDYLSKTEEFIEKMQGKKLDQEPLGPIPSDSEAVSFSYGEGLEPYILQISKQYQYPIHQGWTEQVWPPQEEKEFRAPNAEKETHVWHCVVPFAYRIGRYVDEIHTIYCNTGYVLYDCEQKQKVSDDRSLYVKPEISKPSSKKVVPFSENQWDTLQKELKGFLQCAKKYFYSIYYLEVLKISENEGQLTIYAGSDVDMSETFLGSYR